MCVVWVAEYYKYSCGAGSSSEENNQKEETRTSIYIAPRTETVGLDPEWRASSHIYQNDISMGRSYPRDSLTKLSPSPFTAKYGMLYRYYALGQTGTSYLNVRSLLAQSVERQ